jgi:arylsulfatase A
VVIIYADDMGWGDMSCQNSHSKIQTPHLDQLSRDGLRYTDAHSSSGICTPSRYALLTGKHHWRKFHKIVSGFGPSVFDKGEFTMAEMFRSVGYRTAAIGKWHLGWDWDSIKKENAKKVMLPYKEGRTYPSYLPKDFYWHKKIQGGPTSVGFDEYFGDGTINFPPYAWIENDKVIMEPSVLIDSSKCLPLPEEGQWGLRPGPAQKNWDPYQVLPTLLNRSVDWIQEQNSKKPFFLYFALPSPHTPIIPSEEYRGKSKVGAYGDFMLQTDDVVGAVVEALKTSGHADNTIIVFTSDNGPEYHAYDRMEEFDHLSSGHFRGLKRDLWEGGHRVPWIVVWPEVIQAGRVSDRVINQVDLAATFAKIIGYDLAEGEAMDSYDFSEHWTSESDGPIRKATVHNTVEGAYALRMGDWVWVDAEQGDHPHNNVPDVYIKSRNYQKVSRNGFLFNLKQDPSQSKNLIHRYPEKVSEMRRILNRYVAGEACASK